VNFDTPTIKYSTDNGATYTPAPDGVRVVYENFDTMIEGQEQKVLIEIAHRPDGVTTEVFGTEVQLYDTHIVTATTDLDQIVIDAILIGNENDEDEGDDEPVVENLDDDDPPT